MNKKTAILLFGLISQICFPELAEKNIFVGGKNIIITTSLNGFVEAGEKRKRFEEQVVIPSNRLLAAFVPQEMLEFVGSELEFMVDRYLLLQVDKLGEYAVINDKGVSA